MNEIDRIVILEENVRGNLFRCNVCDINFTAKQPCIMCIMRLAEEKKLGRKLTKEEYDKLFEWLGD